MKLCVKCGVTQPFINFNASSRNLDGKHSYCKTCHREHYAKNAEKYKQKAKANAVKYKANIRQNLWDWYLAHPCVDCGVSNPIVLQADHVRETKIADICTLKARGTNWEKIKLELDKCDSRCFNCHAIKTAKQFGWYVLQTK